MSLNLGAEIGGSWRSKMSNVTAIDSSHTCDSEAKSMLYQKLCRAKTDVDNY